MPELKWLQRIAQFITGWPISPNPNIIRGHVALYLKQIPSHVPVEQVLDYELQSLREAMLAEATKVRPEVAK